MVSLAVTVVLALVVAPADAVQGDAYRLMYLHVPTAWLAYLAFFVTAVASVLWLVAAHALDHLGSPRRCVGRGRCDLHRALRSRWARSGAGRSGARGGSGTHALTTTAILFFLYLGYLALRRTGATADERGKRCAIAALIAFADVPIVHFSVIVVADAASGRHRVQPGSRRALRGVLDGVHARVRGRSRSRCSTRTSSPPGCGSPSSKRARKSASSNRPSNAGCACRKKRCPSDG